jgi:hypothetical protein
MAILKNWEVLNILYKIHSFINTEALTFSIGELWLKLIEDQNL